MIAAMESPELVEIELTTDERRLLTAGMWEWHGPARCSERLAVAMGFQDKEDLFHETRRLIAALDNHESLSRKDWTRALLATEIVFASGIFGSGVDWPTTVGWSDEETIKTLRLLQRKLMRSRAISREGLY